MLQPKRADASMMPIKPIKPIAPIRPIKPYASASSASLSEACAFLGFICGKNSTS